jgi:hypothetical protein
VCCVNLSTGQTDEYDNQWFTHHRPGRYLRGLDCWCLAKGEDRQPSDEICSPNLEKYRRNLPYIALKRVVFMKFTWEAESGFDE